MFVSKHKTLLCHVYNKCSPLEYCSVVEEKFPMLSVTVNILCTEFLLLAIS